MLFKVRTFDAASAAVKESAVEGADAASLRLMLESRGETVLSIAALRPWRERHGVFNLALFCEELRMLLSSGMSLVEAIETLCSKETEGYKREILIEIQRHLQEGKSLSAALLQNRFNFPALLIASIRASERTSRVDEALDEYIAYERVGQELSRKIVSAAIYPALVVGFGFLVCLFMISYVVPRFAKVYEDFSHSLSLSTVILMRVGQFAGDYLWLILLALIATGILLFTSYRNGKLKLVMLRLLGNIGVVRHHLRLYQLSRIYQTMSMLLRGGYALTDAIPLAQNLAFEERLLLQIQLAHGAIMEGKRLSTAFADNGLSDNVTGRLLQVGERSGSLAKIMDIIAHTYRQEFTLFIERATKIAEPLLLMAVGLLIGAIIILMYMPVFDLAGGI